MTIIQLQICVIPSAWRLTFNKEIMIFVLRFRSADLNGCLVYRELILIVIHHVTCIDCTASGEDDMKSWLKQAPHLMGKL